MEEFKASEPRFDKQDYLVGSDSKTNFWELYKSERKFKDFQPEEDINDPRFAYFKSCKELKIQPKAGLLIKEKDSPYMDFENKFMSSTY